MLRWLRRSLPGRLLRRVWRMLRWLILLLAVLFVAATLALELDVTKRWAAATVNDSLQDTFQGHLVIERIGELGWGGVRGATVRLETAAGERLIYADGVAARWELAPLLRSVASGNPLALRISDIQIDYADVALQAGAEAPLRLIEAITPRPASGPDNGGKAELSLQLASIKLAHVWAHGAPAGLSHIDADVDEVDGSLRLEEGQLKLTLQRAQIHTRQMPFNADLAGQLTGSLATTAQGLDTSASYTGSLAEMPVSVEASLNDDQIKATVALDGATPTRMQQLLPSWPLTQPVAVKAHASGTMGMMKWDAAIDLPHSHVTADGSLQLAPRLVVRGKLNARELDLAELSQDLPASQLSFRAEVIGQLDQVGYPLGTLRLDLAPGSVAAWKVPAATLTARSNDKGYQARLRVTSPAALDANVVIDRARTKADVQLNVSADNIDKLATLGLPLGSIRGQAAANLWGSITLVDDPQIRLGGELNATEVRREDIAASHLSATIEASGPWRLPQFRFIGNGVGLAVAGQQAQTARIELMGTPRRAALKSRVASNRLGDFQLNGDIELGATASAQQQLGAALLRLSQAHLAWSRAQQQLSISATRVTVLPDQVLLDGGRLEGLGDAITIGATLRGDQLDTQVDAERIELAKVAELVGAAGHWDGQVALRGRVTGSSAAIKIDIEQTGLGHVTLNAPDIHLAGPSLKPGAWREAAGLATLSGELSLARLSQQLAQYDIDLPVAGDGTFSLQIERDKVNAPPHVSYELKVKSGTIAGYAAVGVDLRGALRGAEAGVQADVRLGKRTILRMAGLAELPAVPGNIAQLASLSNWKQARLLASFWLQPQPIKQLLTKDQLESGTVRVSGEVEMLCNLAGTIGKPTFNVDGRGRNLRVAGLRVPVEAHLRGSYNGRRAQLTLSAAVAGQVRAVATASTVLPSEALWARRFGNLKFGVQGALRQLPAQWVEVLDGHRIGGAVSATFALDDYLSNAGLALRASVEDLSVDGARQGDAAIRLSARNDKLSLDTTVFHGKSGLSLNVHGPIQWGAAPLPKIERDNLELALVARHFRLAAIAPLLAGPVKMLDGNLDGKLTLQASKYGPRAVGDLLWTRGRLQLRGFGERFEPIIARITADGNGGIRLRRFEAKSLGGEVQASARVQIAGLSIKSAAATVSIAEDAPMPLVLDGVSQGHVSGLFEISAARAQPSSPLDVRVTIPKLQAELPQRSRRDVQSLDPPEHIRIGRRGPAGKPVVMFPLARQTPATVVQSLGTSKIQLELGKDVEVRQGDLLRVQLGGGLTFMLTEPLAASGTILLNGGTLDIKGKSFVIQQGTVSFTEDVTNPQINVTAAWVAANGTVVYADYVGPVKEGQLTLRSQPALSRGEILALLLFGTSDRNINAVPGSSAAVSLAGDVATQPLNQALRDITGLDIATRIDTTRGNNPAPEVELRIARNLSLQFTHILGLPTPGENPDRNLTTLVWRFLGNWSVESTVGDQGSAVLDLFWRYSY